MIITLISGTSLNYQTNNLEIKVVFLFISFLFGIFLLIKSKEQCQK
jgi:hypothetical protein